MSRSAWLRHNVPGPQRPTTCCHSPESYLKKSPSYTLGFFKKTARKMKSAQIFSLQYGCIPSCLPTKTHTKDCTAHYTTHHRNASSASPLLLFTEMLSYFSSYSQSLHFPPLSNQMLFHLSSPPTPPQPPSLHPVLLKEGLKAPADGIPLCCTRKRTHLSSGRAWRALWREETSLFAAFVKQMFVFCIQMCNKKLKSSPLLKHF